MSRTRRRGFTLVELLVVIGIIALLISILLPSLNSARAQARALKSASNLRSLGQAMQMYLNEFKQTSPAAYIYEGMSVSPTGQQLPASANQGYRHISSFLYGHETVRRTAADSTGFGLGQDGAIPGAESFRNPQLDSGGLPPTNPALNNKDDGQKNETDGLADYQAPRIGYVFNEAICPRNKFAFGFGSPATTNAYHFVRSGQIKNSSNVILGTEFVNDWRIVSGAPRTGGGTAVCKSHRPVHAFTAKEGVAGDGALNMESAMGGPVKYYRVHYADLMTNTPADYDKDKTKSRLDWVGRYGNAKTWEKRTTNFLYVDGHVENKNIKDTLDDNWQWGERMYSQTDKGPEADTMVTAKP